MKRFLLFGYSLFTCSMLLAQPPDPKLELLRLTDELDAAIHAGDWNHAATLSAKLKADAEAARNLSMSKSGGELVDQILNWLPIDTETIVVAQQPFTFRVDTKQVADALPAAQSYVLGLLGAVEHESVIKSFSGVTIRLAALGAREFKEHAAGPGGIIPLGLIAFQGCATYFFAQSVPQVFQHKPDESSLGHPVWISKGSMSDAKDQDIFVTTPRPDLLLICNDRDFLSQVLTRMDSKPQNRALPTNLPEWKQVDRNAPLWALRHFRNDRADVDPTGVRHLIGDDKKNFEASGLTVEFGIASGSRARILSKENPWESLLEATELKDAAHSREAETGVWEFSIANKPAASMYSVFVLMAFLGFAVYL